MIEGLEEALLAVVRQHGPLTMSLLVEYIRMIPAWADIRNLEVKAVVFPLIIKGELKYTPDLKITVRSLMRWDEAILAWADRSNATEKPKVIRKKRARFSAEERKLNKRVSALLRRDAKLNEEASDLYETGSLSIGSSNLPVTSFSNIAAYYGAIEPWAGRTVGLVVCGELINPYPGRGNYSYINWKENIAIDQHETARFLAFDRGIQ